MNRKKYHTLYHAYGITADSSTVLLHYLLDVRYSYRIQLFTNNSHHFCANTLSKMLHTSSP